MKAKLLLLAIAFLGFTGFSQVGINNTDPKASLDISATNSATPANTDGLLIPRIEDFPATDPTAAQQGMMVYLTTTSGSNPPGFYYWDNNAGPATWVSVVGGSVQKINDLSDAKSDNDGTNDGSSIFIGVNSGTNDDSSNNKNVGIGYSALLFNTSGTGNSAIGYLSLASNTTGNLNTANGNSALRNNTTGNYNTAIGSQSLRFNTVGLANTAIGYNSLESNTTGERNNAFGTSALIENTTGGDNTAIGVSALRNNTVGNYNVAFGPYALNSNLSGSNNIAIGRQALTNNTTSNNTAIGHQALRSNTFGVNLAIGYQSLYSNTTGQNNTAIGFQSLYTSVFGQRNTAIGHQALFTNTSSNNSALGYQSLYANTTGQFNTAQGTLTLTSNTTGNNNTATGYAAISSNTTGSFNTVIGSSALFNNSTGSNNTATGYSALSSNTTGSYNTSIGSQSLRFNTTGNYNNAKGYQSLYSNTTGTYNTANGYQSLYSNTTGGSNLASGYQSLLDNTTGNSNTAIGNRSLLNNTTGSSNTSIGSFAGANNSIGTGNVFLGSSAGSNELGSNTLYIQNNNADADNALIYGEFDNDILRTNSEFQIGNPTGTGYAFPTIDGSSNQLLQTDGSGQLSFIDPATIGDGTGTDDQNISGSGLSGTNLTIGIESGSSQVINLSSLQDGTGTDDQNISGSGLLGTNLTIGIENGTSEMIDLSSINGDITQVIAGDGLTGGGNNGDVTIDVVATNGLTTTTNAVKLGGSLTESTTILLGTNNFEFNINSGGDYSVTNNSIGGAQFLVDSNGASYFGGDVQWRDLNASGTILALLTDQDNDGRFQIMENGTTSVDLNANSQFIFNDQGLDRNFRIESDINSNMFLVDAGTNRIGIGTGVPSNTLHVVGDAKITGLAGTNNRLVITSSTGVLNNITDGLSGQILTTNGTGSYSWVNGASFNTDDQNISGSGLSGTNLTIGIESGSSEVINLSSLQDGTGTDDQNISGSGLSGTNLTIGIESGSSEVINLSSLQDGTGTDNQIISNLGLSGTNLTVGIENGSSQIVDLSSLQDADWYESGNTPPNNIGDNIYTNGKVGINNSSPTGYLDIIANSGSGIGHIDLTEYTANDGVRMFFRNASETTNYWTLYAKADNTAGNGVMNFYSSEVSTNVLRLESDGKVGIMRNPTTNPLEVEGVASKTTAGSWTANSDRRLKKNIVSINGKTALEKINELRGVTYEWNDNKTGTERPLGIQYGFIAQELMEVFPEKVSKDNLGYFQTAYGDYDPLFVEAIKELIIKNEVLSEENKKLSAEITLLNETLKKIELIEARLNTLENFEKNNTDTTNSLAEKK